VRYLLLIYADEAQYEKMSKEDKNAMYAGFEAFGEKYNANILSGAELQPTTATTTVRIRDDETLATDGPFAETKEQLGGCYLVTAANLDEAIAMAAAIPSAKDGYVEIRPLVESGAE
jgi:hypothetical protein